MIYLSPLRRFLLPTFLLVTLILLYRSLPYNTRLPDFILHQPPSPPAGLRISLSDFQDATPIRVNVSENHVPSAYKYYHNHNQSTSLVSDNVYSHSVQHPLQNGLDFLFRCPSKVNNYTGHTRLGSIVQNISQIPPDSHTPETRVFWNPTVIALPYWSKNQYLIVSRIVTNGKHQENVLCEANICHIPGQEARDGEKLCTDDDVKFVGPAGGMRCTHPPNTLSVPPTPAERCDGKFSPYADIPGFHDPRIFWSGKGEPLMVVNTQ